MAEIVWRPSPQEIATSRVGQFMGRHGFGTFDELLARSIDDPAWFWDAVVRFLGIEFAVPYERVLDTSGGIPWTKWFVGGRLNAAVTCLDRHADDPTHADGPAVVWEGEEGETRTLTYGELRSLTDKLAHGLATRGVNDGDLVGIFLPMIPEAIAAILAIVKLGAVFVPIFSGYASDAVAKRLSDAGARALITADGFVRRGQHVKMKETADDAVAQVASVETVVVVPRLGRSDVPLHPGRDVMLDELVAGRPDRFDARIVDSEHPLFLAYTSGTTGRPKGSVHVHGGWLVKVAQEAAFQTDLGRNDRLLWITDLGWIMGPWEVTGALANGAAVVCFDGAPDFPAPDRLWSLVERHAVTVLGVSPTLVRALMAHGNEPVTAHDRSSLRILASTGEPWNEGPWRWYFEQVGGGRRPVINISGGTEVGGCFLAPHPVQPLSPCSLGGPALGMAVDIFDDNGDPVRGTVGELVCTKPWPGMTRGVWNDPQRFLDTYWSRWPDVWWHGDWASASADGEWLLHGRSDDTIKVAGKRLGPAEVETLLVEHPAVIEAAAVGLPDETKGETLWCYVVLTPEAQASERLRAELAGMVTKALGPAFRPAGVRFTTAMPKTRSAKIMRRAIRAVANDETAGDLSGLEDPGALEAIAAAH